MTVKYSIMLPEIKMPFDGGQRLYSNNATAQGLFLIQIRTVYRTRENFVSRVTEIYVSI